MRGVQGDGEDEISDFYRAVMTIQRHEVESAPPERMTLTVEEAAQLLGIGRQSAYQAARTGELPTIKIGRRLLVPLAQLDVMLGARGVKNPARAAHGDRSAGRNTYRLPISNPRDDRLATCRDSVVEHLLHTMHDASKFADGATKAILEGMLHHLNYGEREGPHRGNRCECPHCTKYEFGDGPAATINHAAVEAEEFTRMVEGDE